MISSFLENKPELLHNNLKAEEKNETLQIPYSLKTDLPLYLMDALPLQQNNECLKNYG